ncbi:organomercurial lyase MerB [Acinetobacter baumannii]|uniref:organomercurial lyase MerB n=1 Tax=Acinetobacter baumannii TaxID=470 RepID=UPI00112A1975|nr:organomercurial lyase MerB [Acinetobacter baumannii]TPU14004.1 organomercurial lyase MerB [Acinetobacter baumannii]
MDKTIYPKKIAESLSSGNHPKEFATLFVALLRQLAMGGPVSREKLAGALGWSGARVATVLEQAPGTEYDDEANIIGLGLTLRETPHVFEVDGRRLYTWCALDTLMFPALIGKTARVTSRCAATGRPITLTVAPEAVLHVEPAEAMVSLRTPDASPDIRCSFCCHVHFFASPSVANAWASTHPGIELVPVENAFGLGHLIAHKLLEDSERNTA